MTKNLKSESAVRRIRPRWFTSVMGTGILANATAGLPDAAAGLRHIALIVWVAAFAWLLLLSAAWLVHAVRNLGAAGGHADDPAEAPMYGAPPMAILTVGAGALIVGHDLIGMQAAVTIDWILWTVGTIAGVLSTVLVPYLMFTRFELAPEDASGAWLIPVVPPMVSAATGALLIPHLAAGQSREAMLVACLALFGMAAVASALTATMIWTRLTHFKVPPRTLVPTLWVLLGPFGTSVTAAAKLSKIAPTSLGAADASALHAFALLYGAPAWGFALMWLALVSVLTVRAVREGLPFNLSWWSFVFPLGTVVTATSGLAGRTGNPAMDAIAGVFLVGLALAWLAVTLATARAHLWAAARASGRSRGDVRTTARSSHLSYI